MTTFADLFTDRQLVALTTFSDLVGEARERIRLDAVAADMPDDGVPLREGGTGRLRMPRRSVCIWRLQWTSRNGAQLQFRSVAKLPAKVAGVFARQAIPMVWDYAESKRIF